MEAKCNLKKRTLITKSAYRVEGTREPVKGLAAHESAETDDWLKQNPAYVQSKKDCDIIQRQYRDNTGCVLARNSGFEPEPFVGSIPTPVASVH
jgi:hypothetical protein